jgi:hypothetical protein
MAPSGRGFLPMAATYHDHRMYCCDYKIQPKKPDSQQTKEIPGQAVATTPGNFGLETLKRALVAPMERPRMSYFAVTCTGRCVS